MNRQEYDNPMRRNVFSIPKLVKEQVIQIEADSRMVITTPEILDLSRIVITGCGDSYAAGIAMKPAMETLTGLSVEVIRAVDLARYTPNEMLTRRSGTTLVMAVSNSGGVARVAEAMERAGKYGCLTVAVTGKPESRLAKAAKKVIGLLVPPFEAGNGIRSYFVSMTALMLVAIRIGEVKGRYMMDDSQHFREEMIRYAQEYEKILDNLDEKMFEIAVNNQRKKFYDFVGSGGNVGTAWFSVAKIIEATGEYAVYEDTEGWMHLNCFLKHLNDKFTMLYASGKGPELSRSLEVIDAIAQMEEQLYVVTDDKDLKVPETVKNIVVPGCSYDWMWPLLNYIPVSLLAGYLCELQGEAYGRGCKDNWSVCATTKLLTESKIEIL